MEKDTARIETFSDGIFAVVITLLSIELGIDVSAIETHHPLLTTSNSELLVYLLGSWTKVFAYVNSFAVVLLMWMAHHQIFKLLRTTNNKLIIINGLLLLIIAFVPFPTRTVGEFLLTNAQKVAILFYTGYCLLVTLTSILFMHAVKSSNGILLLKNISEETVKSISQGLYVGTLLNAIVFMISFFAPIAALILNFCMWIFWALTSSVSKIKNTVADK
ncbi:TMEM175 family protein [Mucilaginibacter arboris]|uniref:DUF1211 domain-containing protein n=1 Tax=Mucilaginibacter arboris TaxID=2682090 RepID=A0A7K1T032_9SPHI|nr:TMEM175 family protein [Mucilaginibacter arboris]MVN22878.1 DUF1211 domain-containing protein [Mucilaginibacter arboris]